MEGAALEFNVSLGFNQFAYNFYLYDEAALVSFKTMLENVTEFLQSWVNY